MKYSFWLLGKCDDSNPSAIPLQQLKQWENEGLIKYLGEKNDVREIIAKSSCIVLPSYKEGIPRTLLEAMSMQKPIITTNVSGCKECISFPIPHTANLQIGENGILIPAKNPQALSEAFAYISTLSKQTLQSMGEQGRKYTKSRFCISQTIQTYLNQTKQYATPNNPNLVFISNTSFGMHNFRLPVLQALQNQGYYIHIIAPQDCTSSLLRQEGFSFYPIQINSKGLNPFEDFKLFLQIRQLLKQINPALVFNYTIKPVIYGSLASAILKIPHISIITGLGYVFIEGGMKKKILKSFVILFYKQALKKASSVWFLNIDDEKCFIQHRILPNSKTMILDSEGIDMEFFKPDFHNPPQEEFVFLLIARMLWDKGIGEFVEAIRLWKNQKDFHH